MIDGPRRRHGRRRHRHPPAASTPRSGSRTSAWSIVDEEQRFGVEHKEALKQLRTAVDVLSMSATPIPRTLEMAITGIREMSTIATPPEERHPVLTFVGALRRRPGRPPRSGASCCARARSSTSTTGCRASTRPARRLRELVPEARIAAAHGQMDEHQLEQVMVDFWERKFDVLVCTTIVESGLDVPNANTLIIERADLLGLSQLHQLRGRVGRGGERAYAYFLYPPEKPLTETAHDRLATIAQHSDLGAGMAVAMKDLEIRGAGNLLGGEQSGHIADVGFDLYVRLVGEAVAEFRGDAPVEEPEVKIELPVDAHLPHDYVPERAAAAGDVQAAGRGPHRRRRSTRSGPSSHDRYGDPPDAGRQPARGRRGCGSRRAQAGLTDVNVQGNYVRFAPVDLPDSARVRLDRLYPKTIVKPALHSILVPRPTAGELKRLAASGGSGSSDADRAVLDWAGRVIEDAVPAVRPQPEGAAQS